MEILKFSLSGETAFFKMPEVNSYYYFSYGNIHKVALMGIFGAVLGYKGYAQMKKEDDYPEFYQRFKNLEVAVAPKKESRGYFPKKIQEFNNSVGYASYEKGGNLIIKQQWIEKPCWEIYVKIQDEESKKIAEALKKKTCIYMPYLGSNDHPANIRAVEIFEGKFLEEGKVEVIDSLFPEGIIELDNDEEVMPFIYVEFLPVGLEKITNMYILRKFIFTNTPAVSNGKEIYQVNGKNIVFF